ncbi:MAG: Crp/Fnr family transcriptional regulator [Huintestinicola sp.]|uniref:Crp/Fnr family transcriptional regulator n=1 Tax=Huintestinicola sp. TaxID=2981661 RepID=UPI003F012D4D
MEKYIPVLKNTQLFSGVGEEDIRAMLGCMQARLSAYKKNEYVLRQGERIDNIMVLAEGRLHIQRDDHWGNCSIISIVDPGEMFGESYAAPESGPVMNDVIAAEDSAVIFMDIKKIITVCPNACKFHSAAVRNLFFAISEKNRKLVRKLGYMSKRTTREKLMAYLSEEANRRGSSSFSIPFNRQQLADFLSVDRSAMSNELCRMRDEGLLEFEKNRFKLL